MSLGLRMMKMKFLHPRNPTLQIFMAFNWLNVCCFLLVPSAPPSNVTGRNKSSTSIFVQWDQVPAADQNGVILNYTIKYTETDSSGSEAIAEKTVVVVAPKRNVTLENLNEYKIY